MQIHHWFIQSSMSTPSCHLQDQQMSLCQHCVCKEGTQDFLKKKCIFQQTLKSFPCYVVLVWLCTAATSIPRCYRAVMVHGFVEELVVNEDPEYQWIDRIRTPRASNEARQRLISLMSGKEHLSDLFMLVWAKSHLVLPISLLFICLMCVLPLIRRTAEENRA